MAIKISQDVLDKLQEKHQVTSSEVNECFLNRTDGLLKDDREKHKTNPPTMWFIAETNKKRLLKILFIQIGHDIHIKSAFEPNAEELRIYKKYA